MAGVERWPKPFMALRSSRRTELERAGFKNHVLNDWFGHTGAIAQEHYLQTTEADFEAAMVKNGATGDSVAPLVAPSGVKTKPSANITKIRIPNKKRALMALLSLLMVMKIHPVGFEPTTLGSEEEPNKSVGLGIRPLFSLSKCVDLTMKATLITLSSFSVCFYRFSVHAEFIFGIYRVTGQ